MLEAKKVQAARAALQAGNPKLALQEIESYEKIPEHAALSQEAVLVKIEALSKVGRRTDALALGMSTRDDPAFANYRDRVEAVLRDAGL
jgi:phage shock protein A